MNIERVWESIEKSDRICRDLSEFPIDALRLQQIHQKKQWVRKSSIGNSNRSQSNSQYRSDTQLQQQIMDRRLWKFHDFAAQSAISANCHSFRGICYCNAQILLPQFTNPDRRLQKFHDFAPILLLFSIIITVSVEINYFYCICSLAIPKFCVKPDSRLCKVYDLPELQAHC